MRRCPPPAQSPSSCPASRSRSPRPSPGSSGAKEPQGARHAGRDRAPTTTPASGTRDTTKQVSGPRRFVKRWLKSHKKPRPKKPAIVLDIDDTSLSLYECAKARDFEDAPSVRRPSRPAGDQPGALALQAGRAPQKVAVFFITGRPEPLRDLTVTSLKAAGYTRQARPRPEAHRATTTTRSCPTSRAPARRSSARATGSWPTSGDQRSDLKGGYSLKTYKLPNPMYFTP